ncbi:MAG: hypothetical protein KDB61_05800, partial [Planctomycetes bacterium]|nr:hypothetical protein [Planctomycetota bacterium]
ASPRSRFIQSQAALLHAEDGLDDVIRDLQTLWLERDRNAKVIAPIELGRVYLTTLILRHRNEDLQTVERVATDMRAYESLDPYAPDTIRTFRAIGNAIEERMVKGAEAQ